MTTHGAMPPWDRGERGNLRTNEDAAEVHQPKRVGDESRGADGLAQAAVQRVLDDTHDKQPGLGSVLGREAFRRAIFDGGELDGMADGIAIGKVEPRHRPVNHDKMGSITALGRIPHPPLQQRDVQGKKTPG
jgi:hypothetical protein